MQKSDERVMGKGWRDHGRLKRIAAACAVLGAVLGLTASCGAPGPTSTGTEPGVLSSSAPSDSAEGAAAGRPMPSALKEDAKPTTPPGIQGPDPGIVASTKRGAAGLPDPLPDYPSWQLRAPVPLDASGAASPHLRFRMGYVSYPQGKKADPLPTETTLVLEEKAEGKDFISQVAVLTRGEKDWKPAMYARSTASSSFAAADASQCGACHKGDSR